MWKSSAAVTLFLSIITLSTSESTIRYDPLLSECPNETEASSRQRGDTFLYDPSATGSFPDLKRDFSTRVASPDKTRHSGTPVHGSDNRPVQEPLQAIPQNLTGNKEKCSKALTCIATEHVTGDKETRLSSFSWYKKRAQLLKGRKEYSNLVNDPKPDFFHFASKVRQTNNNKTTDAVQTSFRHSDVQNLKTAGTDAALASLDKLPDNAIFDLLEEVQQTEQRADFPSSSHPKTTSKTRESTLHQLLRLLQFLKILGHLHTGHQDAGSKDTAHQDAGVDRHQLSTMWSTPRQSLDTSALENPPQRSRGKSEAENEHDFPVSAMTAAVSHLLGRVLNWESKVHKRISFVHPRLLSRELGFLQSTRNIDTDILDKVKEITENIYDVLDDSPLVRKRRDETTSEKRPSTDRGQNDDNSKSVPHLGIFPRSNAAMLKARTENRLPGEVHLVSIQSPAIHSSKRGLYAKQYRKQRDGYSPRNIVVNGRLPWMCASTTRWRDLGVHVFPRYIQETVCGEAGSGNSDLSTCWYGNYHCRPSTLSVQVLIRHTGACNDSRVPVVMRRHYFLSVIRINTSCNCERWG